MAYGQNAAAQQQAMQALQDAVRALEDLSRSSRDAGRATDDRAKKERDAGTFIGNAATAAATKFGRDVGFGMAQDLATFGGGLGVGDSFQSNMLRAGRKLPIFGDVVGQIQDPLEEAGGRLAGLMAMAGRAGQPISDEVMNTVGTNILGQAKRAKAETMRAQKWQAEESSKALDNDYGPIGALNWAVKELTAEVKAAVDLLRRGGTIFGSGR